MLPLRRGLFCFWAALEFSGKTLSNSEGCLCDYGKIGAGVGLVIGSVFGASVGSAVVAWGSGSSAPTTFYACLNVKAGTLNTVNTTGAATCGKGNTPVSWNAQGVQGLTGATGPQGPAGTSAPSGGYFLYPITLNIDHPSQTPGPWTCPNGTTTQTQAGGTLWARGYGNVDYAQAQFYAVCPY
jgi:hypothetical protein